LRNSFKPLESYSINSSIVFARRTLNAGLLISAIYFLMAESRNLAILKTMKTRSYSNGKTNYHLARVGETIRVYSDPGSKAGFTHERTLSFPTVTAAKEWMNRPIL